MYKVPLKFMKLKERRILKHSSACAEEKGANIGIQIVYIVFDEGQLLSQLNIITSICVID
jgi:hypothetical protein